MTLCYETVDVFTNQPFCGNPLAVIPDASGLSTAAMQRIAREFNYSETTFVLPPSNPAHHATVRIFTPGEELPFAGHPNVGTAFVLAEIARRENRVPPECFLFEEAAGLVPVRLLRANDRVVGAELTAPQPFRRGETVSPGRVASIVGLAPEDVRLVSHAPCFGSAGLPFLLVELVNAAAVDRASADRAGLIGLFGERAEPAAGLYLYAATAPGRLHARMLAPLDGIDEDPATGSAAVALGGLLDTLGHDLPVEIAQGVRMGRPSTLSVRLAEGGLVAVGGRCVAMMRGTLAYRPGQDG